MQKSEVGVQDPGACFEKSNRRDIERVFASSSGEVSLRLSLLLPPVGLVMLPSTSSRGRAEFGEEHLGNFDGCDG